MTAVPTLVRGDAHRTDDLFGALAAVLAFALATGVFGLLESRTALPSPLVPLGLVGIAGALWRWRTTGARPLVWNRTGALAAAALVGVGLSKALSGLDAVERSAALSEASAWGKNLVVVAGLALPLRTTRQARFVHWALVAAAVAVTVPTLVLTAVGSHRDLGGFISFERWWNDGRIAWLPSGPFGDANELARQLLVLIPVAVALALWSRAPIVRRVAAATAVASVALVLITRSRGALMALAAMALVAVVPWARRRGRLVPVLAGLAVAIVALMIVASWAGAMKRLGDITAYVGGDVPGDSSAAGHASTFRAGLRMWGDHPVVGVGAGNWHHHYLELAADIGIDDTGLDRAPHNVVVELLAETGLVGLIAFGLGVAATARVVTPRWRLPLGVAALGWAVASLTQGFNNVGPLMVLVALAFVSVAEAGP